MEEKKHEVPELLRRGDRPGQAIADELAGIRMVILAALLRGIGGPGAKRDELRLREQEARELLREVVLPPLEGRAAGGAGEILADGIAAS